VENNELSGNEGGISRRKIIQGIAAAAVVTASAPLAVRAFGAETKGPNAALGKPSDTGESHPLLSGTSPANFHADAHALSGVINRPFTGTLEPQVNAVLSPYGGENSVSAENFTFGQIVSFRSAHARASGTSQSEPEWRNATSLRTDSMVVVEGLNVMNVVTADRITARLYGRSKVGSTEKELDPTGTTFENLRIAGRLITPNWNTDLFRMGGFESFQQNDRFQRAVLDGREGLKAERQVSDATYAKQEGVLQGSLILGLGLEPGERALKSWGQTVWVPDFGTIEIANLEVAKLPGHGILTMLRINLLSTVGGTIIVGHALGNIIPCPPC